MTIELKEITCPSCGIHFAYPKEMEDNWRESRKRFHCPNGHGMSYPKPAPEIELLRKEVEELKVKLDASVAREQTQKKKIEELENEIEIWHPREKEPV